MILFENFFALFQSSFSEQSYLFIGIWVFCGVIILVVACLLLKLVVFHIYLQKKGLTTYEYLIGSKFNQLDQQQNGQTKSPIIEIIQPHTENINKQVDPLTLEVSKSGAKQEKEKYVHVKAPFNPNLADSDSEKGSESSSNTNYSSAYQNEPYDEKMMIQEQEEDQEKILESLMQTNMAINKNGEQSSSFRLPAITNTIAYDKERFHIKNLKGLKNPWNPRNLKKDKIYRVRPANQRHLKESMSERLLEDKKPTKIFKKKRSVSEFRGIPKTVSKRDNKLGVSPEFNNPNLMQTSAFDKYRNHRNTIITEENNGKDNNKEEEDSSKETSIQQLLNNTPDKFNNKK